jgi:hypothetical protein
MVQTNTISHVVACLASQKKASKGKQIPQNQMPLISGCLFHFHLFIYFFNSINIHLDFLFNFNKKLHMWHPTHLSEVPHVR